MNGIVIACSWCCRLGSVVVDKVYATQRYILKGGQLCSKATGITCLSFVSQFRIDTFHLIMRHYPSDAVKPTKDGVASSSQCETISAATTTPGQHYHQQLARSDEWP
jgi:hypothetical protein